MCWEEGKTVAWIEVWPQYVVKEHMNETDTSLQYSTATEKCASNDFSRHSLDGS